LVAASIIFSVVAESVNKKVETNETGVRFGRTRKSLSKRPIGPRGEAAALKHSGESAMRR